MAVSLNANVLISVTELNTMCGLSLADGDYVKTLINIASDLIQQITGRCLIATTYTSEKYNGNGQYKLFLKNYPIVSITSLYLWDTVNNEIEDTFNVNDDYLYDAIEGWIYLREGFIEGLHNYQITYKAGYVKSGAGYALPYDIMYACAQLCQFINKFKGKPGIAGESIGTYSYSKELKSGNLIINGSPLPAEIAEIINRYMREDVF